MAAPSESHLEFEGSFAGLGLVDVIQLNGLNLFSGCISVRNGGLDGYLFFRDGELIHAEQGPLLGEEAFYEMMRWPGGQFRLQPNVTTTSSTIRKSTKYLLMDAHRVMDEERAGQRTPPPAQIPTATPRAMPPSARQLTASQVAENLRRIPGVAYAVLLTKEGVPLGDTSYEAETLAGQAVYVAMLGKQLGTCFDSGELTSASIHGTERHLLLLATKNHYLCVLIHAGASPGQVEAEVHRTLTASR
jgi:predicted regulator of Ras-like GTPase activity (Roadblock/LC7/MglB family)